MFSILGIYAIDTVGNNSVAAGSVKWITKPRGGNLWGGFLGPDVLYVVGAGSIYAFDIVGNTSTAPGSVKWTYYSKIQTTSSSSARLSSDGTLILISDIIYAFDTVGYTAGNLKWTCPIGLDPTSALLGPDGTLYAVSLLDSAVYAVATASNGSTTAGSVKWKYSFDCPVLIAWS